MRRLRLIPALIAVLAGVPMSAAAAVPPAPACTLYAAPAGDDHAAGTATAPFRTVGHLLAIAQPGTVGCLQGGQPFVENLAIRHGGTPAQPLVLQSAPGTRATITGRLWVTDAANDVVIRDLDLDGINASRLPSPTVNGDRIRFLRDDVTNDHTAICFALGHIDYGVAVDVTIDSSRVHDCGAYPANNLQHGIYVTRAIRTVIVDSVIDHNADRGIQLYPSAQGTVIEHDIIDANGEGIIFSGDGGEASSNTTISDTIVSGSLLRHDIESWYPVGNPVGTGNLIGRVCVFGGAKGTIAPPNGYAVSGPVIESDPLYVNAAAGDYRLRNGSPCVGMGPNVSATHGGDVLPPVVVEQPVTVAPVSAPTPAPTPVSVSVSATTAVSPDAAVAAPRAIFVHRTGRRRLRVTWSSTGSPAGYTVQVGPRTFALGAGRAALDVRVARRAHVRITVRARSSSGGLSRPLTRTIRT